MILLLGMCVLGVVIGLVLIDSQRRASVRLTMANRSFDLWAGL